METKDLKPLDLAPIFRKLISRSAMAFATQEHFYFDSYDFIEIAKECGDEVEIESTFVFTKKHDKTMAFRINIQKFYEYHEKIGDVRSSIMKSISPRNPNLPYSHPQSLSNNQQNETTT